MDGGGFGITPAREHRFEAFGEFRNRVGRARRINQGRASLIRLRVPARRPIEPRCERGCEAKDQRSGEEEGERLLDNQLQNEIGAVGESGNRADEDEPLDRDPEQVAWLENPIRRHRQHRQGVEGDDDEGLNLNFAQRGEGGPRAHQGQHRERGQRTTDQENLEFDACHSQLFACLQDGLPTQQEVGADVNDYVDKIARSVLAIAGRRVAGNEPLR